MSIFNKQAEELQDKLGEFFDSELEPGAKVWLIIDDFPEEGLQFFYSRNMDILSAQQALERMIKPALDKLAHQ
jgi:hypothetical protein